MAAPSVPVAQNEAMHGAEVPAIVEDPPMLPECPYQPGDKIEDGIKCYAPDCEYKGFSWSKLLEHVRQKHSIKLSALKGTHLHAMGMKEINEKQKTRYQKKSEARKQLISSLQSPTKQAGQESRVPDAIDVDAPVNAGPRAQPDQPQPQQDTTWLALRCWVKCHADGTPVEPLEIKGIANANDLPMAKTFPTGQTTLDTYIRPGLSQAMRANDAKPSDVAIVPAGLQATRNNRSHSCSF